MALRYWVGGTATWDATAGTKWATTSGGAGGAAVPTSADQVLFDAASGANTITIGSGYNPSIFSLTMTGFTGTLAFGSQNITLNGNAATIFNQSATATITGTPVLNCVYSGATGTRVITGGSTETNAVSINISAGTDTITTTALICKDLNFTGFSGTLSNNARTLYGNLTVSSGMTITAGASATTLAATSGTQKITSNGKILDFPFIQNGINGTVQIQDNLTISSTRTYTLTNGALDLNNLILSAGLFSSINSNIRSIAFGTGNITVTGTGTVWTTATSTNMTVTGTPVVNVTNATATATTVSSGTLNEANSISFNFTAGTYTLTFLATASHTAKNVNFTGFAGTWNATSTGTIYGNLTISTGMTLTSSTSDMTFGATSGTKTITTNGKTIDFPLTFNGVGGTWQLQDALTQGSTRAFTITNGTVQLKSGTTNTVGSFVTSGTNLKALQSSVAGSQATLSQASGTVSVSYLSIKDSNAIGGAVWQAYTTNNNTDSGNNTGWNFGGVFVLTGDNNIRLRSFTERGRD